MNVGLYSGFVYEVVGAGEKVKEFQLSHCTAKKLLSSDILIKIYLETSEGKVFFQHSYCTVKQHNANKHNTYRKIKPL